MAESKTTRLSRSAVLCSIALVFIFFLQITVIRDRSLLRWARRDSDASSNEVITCDRTHEIFDICTVNSTTLLDQASLTLFTLDPHTWTHQTQEKIYPYPLKNDKTAISYVREVTITSTPPKSTCGVTHHSPALVFSAGGFSGNFYHDMNEIFIPLFITTNSLFYQQQDVILVITDVRIGWLQKYAELLSALSDRHSIINTNNLTTSHCFSSAVIGLLKHGEMIIDPTLLPYPKTLFDFHAFLKKVYIKDDTQALNPNVKHRPHLTLVSRSGNVSRVILNQEEMIKAAEEIGFNVHVLEPSMNTSMINAYNLIHTSHAMLGVHGAGLTHLLFLRPGSVFVQVVPIGTNWASTTYYGNPAKKLGSEYIEYKIDANESSLAESYGADSLVIKDPLAFHEEIWAKKQLYLKKQNVKLDMVRFRKCLTKAYKKAKIFMDTVG
ncbi:hypothetical protein RIF29_15993 [Crotalaria pallida]|uniref:Glycosyltransferase 61 catalytic domain-containing protein n=1 Tax=Crotalaria pallida TaxID=3830 RepID=A0AAN9FEK8_CROPI